MANNVTVSIVNGRLVIECELNKVARRTSKDTGDVLAAIDFEKLSALCPSVQGALGEAKVSLGVYFMDKARNAVTQAPASKQAVFNPATASVEELRAWALAQTQAPAPVPTTPKATSKQNVEIVRKPATPAQIAARQAFADKAKAGTLKPKPESK